MKTIKILLLLFLSSCGDGFNVGCLPLVTVKEDSVFITKYSCKKPFTVVCDHKLNKYNEYDCLKLEAE